MSDEEQQHRLVTVRAINYDGAFHWGHPASLERHDDGIVVTSTMPGLVVKTETGEYVSPYQTQAHYWTDRWFNVIRLVEPGRGLFGYYCNIASPMTFDGETVSYIDLQLDVRIRREHGVFVFRVVDEDEFEEARDIYGYDGELIDRCYAAVEELRVLFKRREFPFE
jgi:protein associated with RNAse G/E